MSAKQVASNTLNWTKVLSKCSPNVRKTILETRAHHEDLRRQISEIKQSMPKLDFGVYRQTLPKGMAKIVDDAESQLKAYKPPKIDVNSSIKELEQERDLKIQMSQEFIINLESRVDKLKSQLNKLENSKPVDEITVEDVYEIHPELREQIHDAIRNDHWAVSEENSAGTATAAPKEGKKEDEDKEKLNYL